MNLFLTTNVIQYGLCGNKPMFVKKIFTLLIFSLCSFVLCSCSMSSIINDSSSEYDPNDLFADDYPFAEETMMTVLKCFDEKDTETLKSLFSESVVSAYDLDKQIEEAMNYYEGRSTSHDDVSSDISESNYSQDHYVYKSIRTVMDNIMTDNNKAYRIDFIYVLVDEKDETKIGLDTLFLRDPNQPDKDVICSIGIN